MHPSPAYSRPNMAPPYGPYSVVKCTGPPRGPPAAPPRPLDGGAGRTGPLGTSLKLPLRLCGRIGLVARAARVLDLLAGMVTSAHGGLPGADGHEVVGASGARPARPGREPIAPHTPLLLPLLCSAPHCLLVARNEAEGDGLVDDALDAFGGGWAGAGGGGRSARRARVGALSAHLA